ncbi:hypothetical protein [Methanobacterium petrolearium]|uniref:hypothetical protein n=2 Tax=Methanobacterium petrolearium TaxID=710190 RepID=UPI001AEAA77A|nr:hypothetical protein [Methanobacterium petrolearium]MBP1946221.1 small-conductance mechanosensitive channel [Methanobacterium petrolearium]
MNYYKSLKSPGILMGLFGLLWTLGNNAFGPIAMVFGINILIFSIFKGKKQNVTFSIIMVATLALMLTLEYFMVPIENTAFYLFLLIMSLGYFLAFYFSLKPQNQLNKREKILCWTGSILGMISFFVLMGIIYNNFLLSLIMGVFILIMLVIARFIRRRTLKDDALRDEFDEAFTTEKPEEYWFRYKIWGIPKPLRWQGWVCYVVTFLSIFAVLIFDRNPDTAAVIVLAIILAFFITTMFKSNYREIIMKFREDLKEE